jgi:hypothetical protein
MDDLTAAKTAAENTANAYTDVKFAAALQDAPNETAKETSVYAPFPLLGHVVSPGGAERWIDRDRLIYTDLNGQHLTAVDEITLPIRAFVDDYGNVVKSNSGLIYARADGSGATYAVNGNNVQRVDELQCHKMAASAEGVVFAFPVDGGIWALDGATATQIATDSQVGIGPGTKAFAAPNGGLYFMPGGGLWYIEAETNAVSQVNSTSQNLAKTVGGLIAWDSGGNLYKITGETAPGEADSLPSGSDIGPIYPKNNTETDFIAYRSGGSVWFDGLTEYAAGANKAVIIDSERLLFFDGDSSAWLYDVSEAQSTLLDNNGNDIVIIDATESSDGNIYAVAKDLRAPVTVDTENASYSIPDYGVLNAAEIFEITDAEGNNYLCVNAEGVTLSFPDIPIEYARQFNKWVNLEDTTAIKRLQAEIDGVQAEVGEIHGQPDYVNNEEVNMGYKDAEGYPVYRKTVSTGYRAFSTSEGSPITIGTIYNIMGLIKIEYRITFTNTGHSYLNDSSLLRIYVVNGAVVITPLATAVETGSAGGVVSVYYSKRE